MSDVKDGFYKFESCKCSSCAIGLPCKHYKPEVDTVLSLRAEMEACKRERARESIRIAIELKRDLRTIAEVIYKAQCDFVARDHEGFSVSVIEDALEAVRAEALEEAASVCDFTADSMNRHSLEAESKQSRYLAFAIRALSQREGKDE
jgi:hypothetical protein